MAYSKNIRVVFYDYGTTDVVYDNGDPDTIRVEYYETIYPFGLYGSAKLFIAHDANKQRNILGIKPYRVEIYSGYNLVYEGYVDEHAYYTDSGIEISLIGMWGRMEARGLRRLWSDNRITEDAWKPGVAGAPATNICSIDRNERIRFTPRAEPWAGGDMARVVYTAPVGETIRYMTFSYALAEGAQDWTLRIREPGGSILWSVSATGTGTGTITPSASVAGCGTLWFELRSNAAQTPTSGTVEYGQMSSPMVYAETNTVAGYASVLWDIVRDIQLEYSADIDGGTAFMSANTFGVTPFMTQSAGFESVQSILSRVAGFGDSSYNAWAVGFTSSQRAGGALPGMYYEQQPVTTDYDYIVTQGDENLTGGLQFSVPIGSTKNSIWVSYTDEKGVQVWKQEADDSTLAASDSQDRYERRDHALSLGQVSSTAALNYARRYLAQNKYATFMTSVQPFSLRGYVKTKTGGIIPASEVRAGKRIKLAGFISPVGGNADNIFIIQRTEYRPDADEVQVYPGEVETLDVMLANISEK